MRWKLVYKATVVLVVIAMVFMPLRSTTQTVQAEPVTLTLAGVAGACGLGMASSMVSWHIAHGILGGLEEAVGNPEYLDHLWIGCLTGVSFLFIQIAAGASWLLHVVETGYPLVEGGALYLREHYVEPHEPDFIDTLTVLSAPYLHPFQYAALVMDAIESTPELVNAFEQVLTDLEAHNGGSVTFEIEPVVKLEVDASSTGGIYQSDYVSARITEPAEIAQCTDTDNTDPDTAETSSIEYVEFGYGGSTSQSAVTILPSSTLALDGRDWYGCNGWALDFDLRGAGITQDTPIYLAARAADLYGNTTDWAFSEQVTAKPRYRHDYQVTDLRFSPAAPDVGEAVQVQAIVANIGDNNEGNVRVNFYKDGSWSNSAFLPPLDTGETTTASFTWVAQEGAHSFQIQTELTIDGDVTNDYAQNTVVIGTAPLIWVNGSASPATFPVAAGTQGASGTFDVTVQNAGSAATTVTASVGGSMASWITPDTPTQFNLNAGAHREYQFDVDVPDGVGTGNYPAELRFAWDGGPTVVVPIQVQVSESADGSFVYPFSQSSGTVNGSLSTSYHQRQSTYPYDMTIDNYPSTSDPDRDSNSFVLSESEYYRLPAVSQNEWSVDLREDQSPDSSAGVAVVLNGRTLETVTSTSTRSYDIFEDVAIGSNTWQLIASNISPTGSNFQWAIQDSHLVVPVTSNAWWEVYNPGDNQVNAWKDGWDNAAVCATVSSVSQSGDVHLYNETDRVDTEAISGSDVGDEICWSLSQSELRGENVFNFKAELNGAQVSLANIYLRVNFFSGKAAVQAVRSVSSVRTDVNTNATVTLTFTNVGSNIADDIGYADSLPPGLQLVGGSPSGTISNELLPGESTSASYIVKGTTPGSPVIAPSVINYVDPSGFSYVGLTNATVLEIWGGTLQPAGQVDSNGVAGTPDTLSATVDSSLGMSNVQNVQVIATVTQPDATSVDVALVWNGATGKYEGSYVPSLPGHYQATIHASRPFYDSGASSAIEWATLLPNQPPVARASYIQVSGGNPLDVTFDGGDTLDTDGVIVTYDWDVGDDGSVDASGRVAEWTFDGDGTHDVRLTVTDDAGVTDSLLFAVTAGAAALEVPVVAGWNLLSVPLTAPGIGAAGDICGAFSQIAEVNRWYAGGWDSHVCGVPFNDFPIAVGEGYFVKSNTAGQIDIAGSALAGQFSVDFDPGWNLIAFPLGYATTASQLGADLGGVCSEIDRWYAGGWDSHVVGLPFNDFAVDPGNGYFVKCSSTTTLNINVP